MDVGKARDPMDSSAAGRALLAIDVGNTNTVIGLFEREEATPGSSADELAPQSLPGGSLSGVGGQMHRSTIAPEPPGLISHWRIATVGDRTAHDYALVIAGLLQLDGYSLERDVSGVAVTSSVPVATAALRELASQRFSMPFVVLGPGVPSGIEIAYDNPKEVGADRVANAAGAFDRYGGPVIVVDLGTATTFDAITAKGEYLGGAIVPGVEISMDALFVHAAALRRVDLVSPERAIGRSTAESLQSGTVFGFAAQVDGLACRIEEELGGSTVVATGGLAPVIAPSSRRVDWVDPWLTLHGLHLIYELNAGAA